MNNNKIMIIGLVGKLQSGKTTSVNFLKEKYPNIIKLSFADLLKQMILNAGICTKEELWEKKTDFSRMMMQKIGTEIIRKQVSENFWVDAMIKKISDIQTTYKNSIIVIDDVRFKNEAALVKFFHGYLIRIDRSKFKQNNEENKHISEIEQDEIVTDYTVLNDKTLEDLKKNIIDIIEMIGI
jgi:dephospho-CoA kinase